MENGWLTLLIIALFFLCMYVYCYGTTYYEVWKEARDKQRKLAQAQEKEQRIKAEMDQRQKLRDEKYKLANARSLEIQKELKRLEKLRQNA